MGRKTRKPVRTRPKPSIPRIFECPRCEAKAIRISVESKSDSAVIECGSCHLKHVLTEIKQIEEPVDIYGDFLDYYYENIEPEQEYTPVDYINTPSVSTQTEPLADSTSSSDSQVEEVLEPTHEALQEASDQNQEADDEESTDDDTSGEKESEPVGFVPRAKGDVLKKKQKKAKETKKVSLSDFKF